MAEELKIRQNPFTVISLAVYGEYEIHDIQQNSAWNSNPYGDSYAVIPDEMVEDILNTNGFCDIYVTDGVVTGFTAREIPDIPVPKPAPTMEERLTEAEEHLLATDEVAVELYEQQLAQNEINLAQDESLCELYEMMGV